MESFEMLLSLKLLGHINGRNKARKLFWKAWGSAKASRGMGRWKAIKTCICIYIVFSKLVKRLQFM